MMNDRDRLVRPVDSGLSGDIGNKPVRLWIGCSDSPVNLFGLTADQDALVHLNLGNLALPSDISFLASLKMAVDVYEVGEIIVCGHYSCRSIEAAASGIRNEMIGDWLHPLKALAGNQSGLQAAFSDGKRTNSDALAELNVVQQSKNVSRTSVMRDAWARGKQVTIQGMVFDPLSGSFSRFGDPISSAVSR